MSCALAKTGRKSHGANAGQQSTRLPQYVVRENIDLGGVSPEKAAAFGLINPDEYLMLSDLEG